eukprot:COSAG01_NODE_5224_length_4401_cov_157.385170_1_plen_67_part_00
MGSLAGRSSRLLDLHGCTAVGYSCKYSRTVVQVVAVLVQSSLLARDSDLSRFHQGLQKQTKTLISR